jgi:hypothetical protein
MSELLLLFSFVPKPSFLPPELPQYFQNRPEKGWNIEDGDS